MNMVKYLPLDLKQHSFNQYIDLVQILNVKVYSQRVLQGGPTHGHMRNKIPFNKERKIRIWLARCNFDQDT